MKKILIYGDSNVWGDNFLTGKRIDDELQWPNILQSALGLNYKIIQEGLPGRIAGDEEANKRYKNGKDFFLTTFKTHAPLDIIIIALGTNDLQIKYNKKSTKIIEDLLWYKKLIKSEFSDLDNKKKYFVNKKMPNIIYILPFNFDYKVKAKEIFNEKSEEKRNEIIKVLAKSNNEYKYIILNEVPLLNDGIHLNKNGHKKMANVVEEFILKNE